MTYESLTYPALPLPQTHPERSATAATLLGMTPASVENCRVLEVGCANGANLVPLAVALPGSRFVGIDLSARQIAEGQGIIRELGLANIELREADLVAFSDGDAAEKPFDYIICHGVYSWVAEPIQRALLTLCRRLLAPQGVAYISYNTYPGFYNRQPIRDAMLFHLEQLRRQKSESQPDFKLDPHAAVQQSRALVELLQQGVSDVQSSWERNLSNEAKLLREMTDGYIFHDHLETENRPCYFHEFAAAAQTHGLQFMCEAEPLGELEDYPPPIQEKLQPFRKDRIVLEQYLDFLRNQPLRCSLLCRADVVLSHEVTPEQLKSLSASCAIWPASDRPPSPAELRGTQGLKFRSRLRQLTVPDPGFKSVLMALCEAEPRALDFQTLRSRASALLGRELDEDAVADILSFAQRRSLLELHVSPPRFANQPTEKPLASPLVRLQARTQTRVTNLRHRQIEVNPLEQLVLLLLDGKRDLSALLPPLVQAIQKGILVIGRGREKLATNDEVALRKVLTEQLPATLQRLANGALLMP